MKMRDRMVVLLVTFGLSLPVFPGQTVALRIIGGATVEPMSYVLVK